MGLSETLESSERTLVGFGYGQSTKSKVGRCVAIDAVYVCGFRSPKPVTFEPTEMESV